MSSEKVTAFIADADHPLKTEMETVREIILASAPGIDEDVKWGGPSFDYVQPMATMNPRLKDCVALIFHKGEILDENGVLEPGPKGKAYAKFYSAEDVAEKKDGLTAAVKQWVTLMDK